MKMIRKFPAGTACRTQESKRRGAILVLAAVILSAVMAFAAFTVDFGMITVTKGQAQNAADSAAHAAAQELLRSFGPDATLTAAAAETAARDRAVEMVGRFRTGDKAVTAAVGSRDVRFGNRTWNAQTNQWVQTWNIPPYNVAEVTVRRTSDASAALPMTFARVIGVNTHNVQATSAASVAPAAGFRSPSGSERIDLLPIAIDKTTWDGLMSAAQQQTSSSTFGDSYRWNELSGTVSSGNDNILEMNIYPDVNTNLPPGNRGTVDLGAPNNSTNDLKRQIVEGLNAFDMSYFPNGELFCSEQNPVLLNGDPGISAGIEASLKSIIGQVRGIPVFTQVSGPGNNAMYTVTKFVGVRIMAVKLTGGPKSRYLIVQPASFSSPYVVRTEGTIQYDSILSKPYLIR